MVPDLFCVVDSLFTPKCQRPSVTPGQCYLKLDEVEWIQREVPFEFILTNQIDIILLLK